MEIDNKLVVAISKGRVFKEVNSLLEDSIYSIKDSELKTRKILLDSQSNDIQYLLVRGWDIPTFVHSGVAQIGIVGKDILLEKEGYDFIELNDLNIGRCRLSIAGKEAKLLDKSKLRVATRYIHTAQNYFESIGIQTEIIELLGSHEIAPETNLSDVIVDLVETGKTLQQNNLQELKNIREISTRLIANKAALAINKSQIIDFQKFLFSKV
tara:strand:+ start:1594 stop:2226 length:633 start_codon:yes stop_codon:yes gene_type:complete